MSNPNLVRHQGRRLVIAGLLCGAAVLPYPAAALPPAEVAPAKSAAATAAEPFSDYRLSVGDTLSVTVFGRPDLGGQFHVGGDGAVRMPLVGSMPAKGRTCVEIEEDLVARLSKLLDYPVQVTLDIAAYQPVFVVGAVGMPGEVAFTPGLSAMKAFAKAGGTSALRQQPYNHAMDLAAAERDLKIAQVDMRTLLIRRAALDAAINGQTDPVLPPELKAAAQTPEVAEAVAREKALLETERANLTAEIALLQQQQGQFVEESKALQKQMAAATSHGDMVRNELNRVQPLAERGLATNMRLQDLRTNEADADRDRYGAAAAMSRAQQQITDLGLRMRQLEDELRRRYMLERRNIDVDIERARARIDGAQRQFAAVAQADPSAMFFGRGELKFSITREGANGPEILTATAATLLRPGDILEVGLAGDVITRLQAF